MTNSLSLAASNDFPEPTAKHGLTVAERLIQAMLKLKHAEAEVKALKDEFAQAHDYGTYREGEVTISVTHKATLNKTRAERLYGDLDIYEPTVTAAKLKLALTGSQYDALLDGGDPVVSVKL